MSSSEAKRSSKAAFVGCWESDIWKCRSPHPWYQTHQRSNSHDDIWFVGRNGARFLNGPVLDNPEDGPRDGKYQGFGWVWWENGAPVWDSGESAGWGGVGVCEAGLCEQRGQDTAWPRGNLGRVTEQQSTWGVVVFCSYRKTLSDLWNKTACLNSRR